MISLPPLLARLTKNKHFKYGVPFLALVVGAPFVLKDLFGARYEYRRVTTVAREQEEKIKELGINKKDKEQVSPEKLHEQYMKKEFQDDYEIVRGPRPWEETTLGKGNRKVKPVVKTEGSYGL